MEIRKQKVRRAQFLPNPFSVYPLTFLTTPIQREESIAKRRNFQPSNIDDGIDSDDDVELGSSSFQDTLPSMLQAVYSDDQEVQLEATMKFRKCVQ